MKTATLWVLRRLAGVLLIVVGLVLSIPGVPGPGLVLVFAGLTLLGYGPQARAFLRSAWARLTGRRPPLPAETVKPARSSSPPT